jgi:hypothetical protein
MTLTVELTPEEKARIEAETGMNAEEWARKWIQVGLSQLHQSRAAGEMPDALMSEERERLLDEDDDDFSRYTDIVAINPNTVIP